MEPPPLIGGKGYTPPVPQFNARFCEYARLYISERNYLALPRNS